MLMFWQMCPNIELNYELLFTFSIMLFVYLPSPTLIEFDIRELCLI